MTEELNLTPEQGIMLIVALLLLVIYLWRHLGTYQLHIELEEEPEDKYTDQPTNDRYGAYIWLAGKRYN